MTGMTVQSGLWDDFLHLAKKSPAAKGLVDQAEARIQRELFLEGLDDKNLTPQQRSEVIEQIEKINGLTENEMVEIVEEVLKGSDCVLPDLKNLLNNDTIIQISGGSAESSDDTLATKYAEGMALRVAEKGYQEEQVRAAIEEMLLCNIDVENVADHVVERIIDRNVTAKEINDAIQKPLQISTIKYDDAGKPSRKMIGCTVTVVQNPETGKLITVYRTSSKLAERLMKGNEYENQLPK